MAELGPVELLLVQFPGNQFTGEIIPALQELVETGTIRIIDLVFVAKDADGNAVGIELEELDDDSRENFNSLVTELEGLIADEDIEDLAAALEPNSSAGILLFENTWAKRVPRCRRRLRRRARRRVSRSRPKRWPRSSRPTARPADTRNDTRSTDMGLRRGRPIMRTAAIVGTASAVSGSVQHHQQQKYAAQDQAQYDAADGRPAAGRAAAPAAAPAAPDMNAELTQLAQLHAQGILTDEEFAAKKAQILGI